MKYYRNYIAAALCLAMLTSTGCSLGNKNSSSSGIADFSYSSDSCEKYDLKDFSFELNKDFTVEEKDEYDDGTGVYGYEFTSNDLKSLSIGAAGASNLYRCTAEVYVQAMLESINSSEGDPAADVETAKLDIPGFNAAAIHITNIGDDDEKGESHLYLTVDGAMFHASVDDYKPEDRDKIKALFRDIASTVKYTGTDQHSTEQQFYDCDLFSLDCGSEWYIEEKKNDKNDELSIKLSYYYSHDMEHYNSPCLAVDVQYLNDGNNAKKAADKNYKSKKESKLISECERSTEELLGYNAETVSFVLKSGTLQNRYKNYYFNENGYLYIITECLNLRDEEGSKSELKEILDTVVIKKLSDEEIEKKKQTYETEHFPSYTFRGVSFNLSSDLELRGELDDSYADIDFSYYGTDLRISVLDSNGDIKNAAQTDQKALSGIGYENVNIKEVTAANNTFKCISGVNSEEGRRAEDYLIIANKKLWKFRFGFDEDDYEEKKYIAEKFLESLDLSNAE